MLYKFNMQYHTMQYSLSTITVFMQSIQAVVGVLITWTQSVAGTAKIDNHSRYVLYVTKHCSNHIHSLTSLDPKKCYISI